MGTQYARKQMINKYEKVLIKILTDYLSDTNLLDSAGGNHDGPTPSTDPSDALTYLVEETDLDFEDLAWSTDELRSLLVYLGRINVFNTHLKKELQNEIADRVTRNYIKYKEVDNNESA